MLLGCQAWMEVMRGDMGPPGAESVWAYTLMSLGRPLNLVLYKPFRMFAYSSNIVKDNFDLMDSMPACGTLKQARFFCKSLSLGERAPAMKFLWLTSHPWRPSICSNADFMDAY